MTTFIGIAGAKGGVGRTSVAINLACALEAFSRDSIIVDCHFKKPNIGLYLGFTNVKHTLNSALRGDHKVVQAMYHHSSGIDVIPAEIAPEEIDRKLDGHHIADTLYDLLYKTEIVLIDTPSDIHDAREVLKACDQVILVTQADLVSITDTLKTAKISRELGKKILGAVVSHSKNRNFDVPLENIEGTLQCPVIGEIPYDEHIHHANSVKNPVVYTHPHSNAAHAYKKLASNLIGKEYKVNMQDDKNFVSYLLERVGFKNP